MVQTLHKGWADAFRQKIEVKNFIGCVEHSWDYVSHEKLDDERTFCYELNFIFEVELVEASVFDPLPQTDDPNLTFTWVPLKELPGINLMPSHLKAIVFDYHFKRYGGIFSTKML